MANLQGPGGRGEKDAIQCFDLYFPQILVCNSLFLNRTQLLSTFATFVNKCYEKKYFLELEDFVNLLGDLYIFSCGGIMVAL